MEVVYYSDGKEYAIFNGIKYSKGKKGYYTTTLKQYSKEPSVYRLHRAIWAYHKGEIPEGYDIHHKDGNKENNNIENLEPVEHGEHSSKHVKISIGKSWHNKPLKTYSCTQCGELFQTTNCYGETQNKFCSRACCCRYHYEKQKRPEISKVCPHCGKKFVAIRTDHIYCCNICAQVERTKRYRAKKKMLNK